MSRAQLSPALGPSASANASWAFVTLVVWFAASVWAGMSGAFVTPAGTPPSSLLLAVLVPVAAFGALYRLVPAIRTFVLGLDLRWLVLIHSWRFVGVSFMILSAYGVLPLIFSVPAGVGDGLVAIGALTLGAALYSQHGVARRALLAWNTFGLADFIVAVGVGALSGSSAMASFPLAIVPGFLVPLFTITHVIVYIQLRAHWIGQQRIRPDR